MRRGLIPKGGGMKISNHHLAIGVPNSFPWVPASFFESFVMMEKTKFSFIPAWNGPIDTLRNDIVKKALEIGASHLIMMDVDQVYHPKTLKTLLSRKIPIVGAAVCRRYPPFDPIIMFRNDEGYEYGNEWNPDGTIECDATGTGCILFEMSIFREMDSLAQKEINDFEAMKPTEGELSLLSESTRNYIKKLQSRYVPERQPGQWFKFRVDESNGLPVGEDIGFCQDLKEAGYRIFVDCTVPAGHLATMVINRNTHLLYRAMKTSQATKKAALGVMQQ